MMYRKKKSEDTEYNEAAGSTTGLSIYDTVPAFINARLLFLYVV